MLHVDSCKEAHCHTDPLDYLPQGHCHYSAMNMVAGMQAHGKEMHCHANAITASSLLLLPATAPPPTPSVP